MWTFHCWTGLLINLCSFLALLLRATYVQRTHNLVSVKTRHIVYCLATNTTNTNLPVLRDSTEVCDEIDSLAINGGPEAMGVTTFLQEACTIATPISDSLSHSLYPKDTNIQDLTTYFSRPVCIQTDSVILNRNRLYAYQFYFNNLFSNWVNGTSRIAGTYGARATIVFTLQVSATPFHQGLISLNFQYGGTGATYANCDRAADSCTSTNVPHVLLDLSADTMVKLRVPFLFIAEYCNTQPVTSAGTAEPFYGTLSINNVCLAAVASGVTPAKYQLFLSLEDIEFFGARPQAVAPITLQAGRKLSPVTEEFSQETKPFSSAIHHVSKAISFIAKGVPMLSSIGGPTAWFLDKAAGAVRFFGYGKPAITDPLMRVQKNTHVGEWHTDLPTGTFTIAPTATNTLAISPNIGYTDVDEMSLSFITSRYSQICNFNITTDTASGTLAYATAITPLMFWFRVFTGLPAKQAFPKISSGSDYNSFQPSHLFFASSFFKYWRGGVKFRFTFAKTKMHAGRVMVCFNPEYQAISPQNAVTGSVDFNIPFYGASGPSAFGHSAIFNLRDGNVFEFTVPYISPIPYSFLTTSTGTLAMYVVDPLLAPSLCANYINCMVEVAGDSDYELADPVGPLYPAFPTGTIALQAGKVLGNSSSDVNLYTTGESITSVKQLISIPSVSVASDGDLAVELQIPPWYYHPQQLNTFPSGAQPLPGSFTNGGNWATCYAFCRGGTDFHASSGIRTKTTFTVLQKTFPAAISSVNVNYANHSNSSAPIMLNTGEDNSVHCRLPNYHPTLRLPTYAANSLIGPGLSWNGLGSRKVAGPSQQPNALNVPGSIYFVTHNGVDGGAFYYSTNASDDAQLAMYVGPPPLFLPTNGSAVGNWDLCNVVDSGF